MVYTRDAFVQWVENIPSGMDWVTKEFAKKEGLKLDLSVTSLDALEKWILKHFDEASDLRDEEELWGLLALYVGETFIKHTGGEWFVDLENKKSIFYQHIVIKYLDKDGDEAYRSSKALCTTCITRKKGNLLSSTLKKHLQ